MTRADGNSHSPVFIAIGQPRCLVNMLWMLKMPLFDLRLPQSVDERTWPMKASFAYLRDSLGRTFMLNVQRVTMIDETVGEIFLAGQPENIRDRDAATRLVKAIRAAGLVLDDEPARDGG